MHITLEIPYLSRRQLDALADGADQGDTDIVVQGKVKEVDQQRRVATITCKPDELKVVDRRSGRTLHNLLGQSRSHGSGSEDDRSPRPSPPRDYILEPRSYMHQRRRSADENAPASPFDEAFRRVFPGAPSLPR